MEALGSRRCGVEEGESGAALGKAEEEPSSSRPPGEAGRCWTDTVDVFFGGEGVESEEVSTTAEEVAAAAGGGDDERPFPKWWFPLPHCVMKEST